MVRIGKGEGVTAAREAMLVVDDDRHFRALTRELLERVGFAVVEAADADQALAAAEHAPPQLVLLDVRLPGVNGYELLRELRDRFGDRLPIIFVSGERTDLYDRVVGLLLGADDYILKPFEPDELIARVRRSLRGGQHELNGAEAAEDVIADLTPREREILALLAAGRSAPEIARQLMISARTVSTHIQRILKKLGVHTRTQAVAVAYRAAPIEPGVQARALNGAEAA
jgi:two-component system nitrate/nitrite response regulator NarL